MPPPLKVLLQVQGRGGDGDVDGGGVRRGPRPPVELRQDHGQDPTPMTPNCPNCRPSPLPQPPQELVTQLCKSPFRCVNLRYTHPCASFLHFSIMTLPCIRFQILYKISPKSDVGLNTQNRVRNSIGSLSFDPSDLFRPLNDKYSAKILIYFESENFYSLLANETC